MGFMAIKSMKALSIFVTLAFKTKLDGPKVSQAFFNTVGALLYP